VWAELSYADHIGAKLAKTQPRKQLAIFRRLAPVVFRNSGRLRHENIVEEVRYMSLLTKLIGVWAAVAWLLGGAVSSIGAHKQEPPDGQARDGLRIRLHLPAAEKGEKLPSFCMVTLENVGSNDLNVKLGFSLANGKSHHPDAIRLLARSAGNKTRTLTYVAVPGVAGRMDPFVLPLPAGSSYTLRCAFDKYLDLEAAERIDLSAKDYRLAAELIGEAITENNPDVKGLGLISCWEGKVRSNEVQLASPKRVP